MNSKLKLSSIITVVLLAGFLSACKTSPTSVTVSTPPPLIGKQVTGDTLHGVLSGTVPNTQNGKAHPIYYMDASVIIPKDSTLLIQPGITIYMLNTGSSNAKGSPDFQVYGSLICAGEKGSPIYLTIPEKDVNGQPQRKYSSLTDSKTNALWGGIEGAGPTNALTGAGSGDIIIKWTHIEFAGATSVVGDPIVKSGGTRYAVWFQNPNAHFIMEDSWITGSTDDPLRVSGGKISIFRNVVECASPNTGDFNMKAGTIGDIAYNVFVGVATNGPKLANSTGNPVCTVNIYNNTVVTCGWRVNKTSRAGSLNIEDGARGTVFNNLVVNCRTGFRLYDLPTLPDTANTAYGYQYYYGSVDSVALLFYPNPSNVGGIEIKKTGDVAGAAKANDPKFVNYNVDQFPASVFANFPLPIGGASDLQTLYPALNLMRSMDENGNQRFVDVPTTAFKSDFHLAPGSPAIGKAYTGAVKLNNGTTVPVPTANCPVATDANHIFGTYNVKGLGADYGAYQTDGSGNQQ